jgi:hypothetical protein
MRDPIRPASSNTDTVTLIRRIYADVLPCCRRRLDHNNEVLSRGVRLALESAQRMDDSGKHLR